MSAAEFVRRWKLEKEELMQAFSNAASGSATATMIGEMGLTLKQQEQMRRVLESALTDTMYSLLLGLDGAGSIGSVQETFKIEHEDGTVVSSCGELEAEAWRQFFEDI